MTCAAPNPLHWQDLRNRPRDEVLRKPAVSDAGGAFDLSFLDARYRVDPEEETVWEIEPEPGRALSRPFQILLLTYLIGPPGGPPSGEVITEKELPGGVTFFQGPHALPVHAVVDRFGQDPDGFETAGRALGGQPVDHGDRAVRLHPFAGMPVTYVLWLADEEFPASVSVLFDRTIQEWFELDGVFLLVGEISRRLAGA